MRFVCLLVSLLSVGTPAVAARGLLFTVETAQLRVTDAQALIEYYVTIDGASVRYARTAAGTYEARVALTVTVADTLGGVKLVKKYLLRSPALPDTLTAVRRPFRLHEQLGVVPGQHVIAWTARDDVRGPTSDEIRVEMPLTITGYPARLGVQVADIQLLEAYEKTTKPDAFTKAGYALDGRTSDFYPPVVETLKFYTEVYHTNTLVGAGQPVQLRYRVRLLDSRTPVTVGERRVEQPAAAVNVVLSELNLGAVPSGNCELLVEVLGTNGKVLAQSRRLFQRSNPGMPVPGATDELSTRATATSKDELRGTFVADLDSTKLPHYLRSLRPVSTMVEAAFLVSLADNGTARQQRAYLYHFWQKQSATEATERWAAYLRRIDYVDKTFANPTFRGYETDQGRVYLQFGPPDQIFTERNDPQRATSNTDGRPYQIWNYYKLRNLASPINQTNRTFVFFQRNLGDPAPRLIHSNAQGEVADPNWRTVIGQKFSGNSRFDRNAGGRQ